MVVGNTAQTAAPVFGDVLLDKAVGGQGVFVADGISRFLVPDFGFALAGPLAELANVMQQARKGSLPYCAFHALGFHWQVLFVRHVHPPLRDCMRTA